MKKQTKSICLVLALLLAASLPARAHDELHDWVRIDPIEMDENVKSKLAYGPLKAVPMLIDYLQRRSDSNMSVDSIVQTLRDLEDPRAVPALLEYGLSAPDYWPRVWTVEMLGRVNARQAIPQILSQLGDPEFTLHMEVLRTLARMRAKEAVPALIEYGEQQLAKDPNGPGLGDLCFALGRIGDPRAIPFLRRVLVAKFEPTISHWGDAAYALALLNDRESGDTIAKIDQTGMRALRLLKHPEAMRRAKEILQEAPQSVMELEEAWVFEAVRVYAEMGTQADVPFLKQLYQQAYASQQVGMLSLGGPPPLGEGNFQVLTETYPVFFGWALLAMGDPTGEQMLDEALNIPDGTVIRGNQAARVREAARVYVRLGRTDKYPLIAQAFRRDDFPRREHMKMKDIGLGGMATDEMIEMLQQQRSPAALELLVKILNSHHSPEARRAVRAYPVKQSLPLLEKQLITGEEWEKWEIATEMHYAGEAGLQALSRLARSAPDEETRMVAMRAVITNESGNWQDLLCQAAQDSSPLLQEEIVRWFNNRFERFEPNRTATLCGG